MILPLRPATPEEIEAQRQGMLNYKPGERQCHPMIPYVSIDIETTGLDPEQDQIIEFAAVIDNWVDPVDTLPVFHRYVQWDRVSGSPRALSMNAQILGDIADIIERKANGPIAQPSNLVRQFIAFLTDFKIIERQGKSFTAAGKNFAGFDRQFIKRLPGANQLYMNHRSIDPAMLFWKPGEAPPSTSDCAKAAGLDPTLKHRAVDDAKQVIRMIRWWQEKSFYNCNGELCTVRPTS